MEKFFALLSDSVEMCRPYKCCEADFKAAKADWEFVLALALILMCGAPSHCEAQPIRGPVSVGSFLNATAEEPFWVSKQGTFAFGFLSNQSGVWQVSIWYAGDHARPTVVWQVAKRFDSTASLVVEKQGLVVRFHNGSTNYTQIGSGLGEVQQAEMLDNGNFVLRGLLINSFPNHSGLGVNTLYQTFDAPTDTLLPNQQYHSALPIISSSNGKYRLSLSPDFVGVELYMVPQYTSSNPYWVGGKIGTPRSSPEEAKQQPVALLSPSGSFTISVPFNGSNSIASDPQAGTTGVLRRLKLDDDGILRMYRRINGNSSSWSIVWQAEFNPCFLLPCGTRICNHTAGSSYTCGCPGDGSALRTEGCTSQGVPAITNCNQHQAADYQLLKLPNTAFFVDHSDPDKTSSDLTEDDCQNLCLGNCSCVAAEYRILPSQQTGDSGATTFCWTWQSIPTGGYISVNSRINNSYVWFNSSNAIVFLKVANSSGPAAMAPLHLARTHSRPASVYLMLLSLGVIVLVALMILWYVRYKRSRLRSSGAGAVIKDIPAALVAFSFRELRIATNNFSSKLGSGGFGTVYKGMLPNNREIAVKRLDRVDHEEKQFLNEVKTVGTKHHMNLVCMHGYCVEGSHRLLVYEYLSKGSLERHLFQQSEESTLLDWSSRLKIAHGTALGITYFHELCRDRIIHCDIKPENILLDDHFNAKVSDFGMAKLMGKEQTRAFTTPRGTRGYFAPEWFLNLPITAKADVYSFGMVLLELIGGRRNIDPAAGPERVYYPSWAYDEMVGGNYAGLVDSKLNGAFDVGEVELCTRVAFWCIQDAVERRPSMGEVVEMLQGRIPVTLPPMPQTIKGMLGAPE